MFTLYEYFLFRWDLSDKILVISVHGSGPFIFPILLSRSISIFWRNRWKHFWSNRWKEILNECWKMFAKIPWAIIGTFFKSIPSRNSVDTHGRFSKRIVCEISEEIPILKENFQISRWTIFKKHEGVPLSISVKNFERKNPKKFLRELGKEYLKEFLKNTWGNFQRKLCLKKSLEIILNIYLDERILERLSGGISKKI